jgi:MFS family permease
MSAKEIDPERAHGGLIRRRDKRPPTKFADLLRQRPLLILAGCVMLFHLANSAMLPLMASVVTMRSSQWATVLIAACIVVPQLVVAALSPWVGRQAVSWGRRPLLLLGFAALPIRGILFATVKDPNLLVAVQILDGLTASVFGVMVPLIIADLTRGTGHFNLGQGIVGTTTGIGASLSTTLAGYTSDHLGSEFAFLGLAAVAAVGLAAVWFLMPETRPIRE